MCRRHRPRRCAFTLLELVVIIVGTGVLTLMLMPMCSRPREIAHRAVCSANLRAIYQGAYAYGSTSRGRFPIAGNTTAGGSAVGFREGDRSTGTGAQLDDNATASLWLLILQQMAVPKTFMCHSAIDAEPDRLTLSMTSYQPVPITKTRDFLDARNLCFSVINMYGPQRPQWSQDTQPNWVLMSDDNAADHPDRAATRWTPGLKDETLRRMNCPNHGGEGQNLLFGDGHIDYVTDPFQGPDHDNVFTRRLADRDAPVTLQHDPGGGGGGVDGKLDVVLLPITGNRGISLSGLPPRRGGSDPPDSVPMLANIWGVTVLAACICWIYWGTVTRKRRSQPQPAAVSPPD